MKKYIDRVDWKKCDGLLPVIVQESSSKDVLMMAFMNEEALTLSLESGYAHYFSRTKQRIWKKGESSGNVQIIKDISIDCDNDTLLIKIEQVGGIACHTGRKSCFFTNLKTLESGGKIDESATSNYSITDKLYHVIKERKHEDPSKSYVASLFNKGENAYLKKVIEEAGEFCFAIKDSDEKEIVYEAADLVFHLLVALGDKNIDPDRIKQELSRRFGLSGIEEKNSRDESSTTKTESK